MPRRDPAVRARRGIAALAGAGGLLSMVATFLPWITTQTEDGGTTTISGWGSITGSSGIAGTNLNDVMDGWDTYRPGIVGLIFGALTLIAAIALAATSRGPRPHRITASVLMLCGLTCLGFGMFRVIDPGDAGVFEAGEAVAAVGPWLTAAGGALVVAAAVLVIAGRVDPPVPVVRHRGIQPRR